MNTNDGTGGNRVFVSSTCYDLIDIRSEIEELLVDIGLVPIMSDRQSSEFTANPDVNSIESCLINVRQADAVIVVLSQRYGPSLQSVGYDDVSATHLEYREAVKLNKPIFFYVRDRLEAEFAIWVRNGKSDDGLAWIKKGDSGILNFLEDHRALQSKSEEKNNWFWVFRDSVELKKRIRKDFSLRSGPAILEHLTRIGTMPFVVPRVNSVRSATKITEDAIAANLIGIEFDITVKNVGNCGAINTSIEIDFAVESERVNLSWPEPVSSVAAGESVSSRTVAYLRQDFYQSYIDADNYFRENLTVQIHFEYYHPLGHVIVDKSVIALIDSSDDLDIFEVVSSEFEGKTLRLTRGNGSTKEILTKYYSRTS